MTCDGSIIAGLPSDSGRRYAPQMDNITAALIGTAVGSLATIAAAIAGPSIAARTTFRRQQRRDIRDEIANTLHSFMNLLAVRRTGAADQLLAHAETVTASTRLAVLLGPRELDVERAVDYALELVSNNKYAVGVAATSALRIVLHAWYRGEVKGRKIGDRYGKELESALKGMTAE